jgi:hypothetical protein
MKRRRLPIRSGQIPVQSAIDQFLTIEEIGFEVHATRNRYRIVAALVFDNPMPREVSSSIRIDEVTFFSRGTLLNEFQFE